MTTITCIKIVRNPQNPWNPPPVTFLFKDEGSLATHPLSCHPQRVFGSPESEKKMRETRGKVGELKASCQKLLLKKKSFKSLFKWAYIPPKITQIIKMYEIPTIT